MSKRNLSPQTDPSSFGEVGKESMCKNSSTISSIPEINTYKVLGGLRGRCSSVRWRLGMHPRGSGS